MPKLVTNKRAASVAAKLLVLAAACFVPAAFAQSWVSGSPPNDSVATQYFPYLSTVTSGVKYGSHNSSEVGDIYVPNYNGKTPPANASSRPAVLVVHGGGGTSGTRTESRSTQISQFCAAHGYVAFNIDYTLGAVWPKNVYDWRLAIRYLRAHAATYGIDPNHIGVIGGSYGGFCAANLSGITNGQMTLFPDSNAAYNNISLDVYSGEPLNAYSGDIQVACDLYGPTDQTTSGNAGGSYSSPTTATLKNSSAVQYVHPTSAPVLVSHGTADTTVSISQSEEFTNYLGQFHVPFQFKVWSGVGHTFEIYQSGVDMRKQWMDFFDTYLLSTGTAPYIQVQPANQTGCVGYSASFSVTANGSAPLAYQWYGNSVAILNAKTNAYSIASISAGMATNYFVVITNASGSVTSSVVTLGINNLTAPAITNDLNDQEVLGGSPVTFTIGASGSALQYQWYLNGQAIANATNASYNIASAANTDAGQYQAVAYNACGSAASLVVNLLVDSAPTITANPFGSTNCTGDAVTFEVDAIGSAPLSYQWHGPAGGIGSPGANNLFTLTNLVQANSGNYFVVISNAYGYATSSIAPLLVSSNNDVNFTGQPSDTTIYVGSSPGSASFTVTVSGGGNYGYLWLKNDYDTITNGVATNATLTVTNLTAADSGTFYHCLVNNDCSIFSSADATVNVISTNVVATTVATNFTASGGWLCPAGVTSVQVQCWGGGGSGGAAGVRSSGNYTAAGGGAGGTYVTNGSVTVTAGNTYTFTVGAGGAAPAVPANSTGIDGNPGGATTFGTAGSLATPVVANGGPGGHGANASTAGAATSGTTTGSSGGTTTAGGTGAAGVSTSSTSTTFGGTGGTGGGGAGAGGIGGIGTGTTAQKDGQPGAVPGGAGGGGYSSSTGHAGGAGGAGQITITYAIGVQASAPSIVQFDVGQTNAAGSSFSLAVSANGSAPLSYSWFKNNAYLASYATAILNISSATTNDSGAYFVIVSNFLGSVTSSVANVLITNAPPAITAPPQNQTVYAGATANFSVTAVGTPPLAYQWLRNGSPIGGATAATYGLSGAALADSGSTFSVVVTNAYGSATSSSATLTVQSVTSVGTVVIDEVYAGGGKTGAAYNHDYVVLKNISASSVNVSGWSLQHDKVGAWQTPYVFTNANAVIPPGGYYLIQCYNDGGTPAGGALPTPDEVTPQSSAWNMSYTSADAVALVNTSAAVTISATAGAISTSAAAAAGIVDLVGSDTATGNDYFGSGATPAGASSANAVTRNAGGCQNTPDNSLDFAAAAASPKNSATAPSPCAPSSNAFYSVGDGGQFIFGGEILTLIAGSGMNLAVWSSPDPTIAVTNWGLEGQMQESPYGNGTSRYSLVVTPPASSLVYYVCAAQNTGPYTAAEPLTWLTTDGDQNSTVTSATNAISPAGVFQIAAGNTPPSIAQQPVGVTNAAGGAWSLSVVAGGSSPLAYQWFNGANPVGGATGASYGDNAASTNDSGAYTVVVTNAYGSITSSVAAVLITNIPPTAPFIITQPQAGSVVAGSAAGFSVTAGGSQPLSYQWLRSGSPIVGATGSAYSLNGAAVTDSGSTFAVIVTNAYGSVTSSVVSLTVSAAAAELLSIEAVKAHYYVQTNTVPTDETPGTYSWAAEVQGILPAIITNTTVSFSGTNAPNPLVQSAIDYTGLAQDEIFFPTKAALDAAYNNGNFHYVTKFASGSVYTNDIPLGTTGDVTNNDEYPNAPALTAPAGDWANGVLTVHAVAGGYQLAWAAMGAPQDQINIAINDAAGRAITEIDGLPGNLTNCVLPGSVLDPGTNYQMELTFTHMNYQQTNAVGAILYGLYEADNDFTIHTDPAGAAGAVTAANYATVRNGTNAPNDVNEQAVGYLMAKYSAAGASAKAYLQFDLTGTNADTTSPATLRLYRSSGSGSQHIQIWALNQAFSAPTNFNNVSWNQAPANDTNGNALLTNGPATATMLVNMQAFNLTNAPVYDIVIPAPWGQFVFGNKVTFVIATAAAVPGYTNSTSGFRTVITNSLQLPALRFSAPQPVTGSAPTITNNPASLSVLAGQNAGFSVAATGTAPLGYQWSFANAPIAGATAAALNLTNVSSANAGAYVVIVTNAFGSVTSSPPATLTVLLPPVLAVVQAAPGSGSVGLNGTTLPGLTYVVQGSASLSPANWINLLTNVTALDGSFSFQTNAAAAGNQYYRLVFP